MKEEKTAFEKVRQSIRNSVTLKLLGIGFIILLLMIPISMVEKLIWERKSFQDQAHNEITSSWGNQQAVKGLVLTIPYEVTSFIENLSDKTVEEFKQKKYAHFLPEMLNIKGEMKDDHLNRGIYDVLVYESDLSINGHFIQPVYDDWLGDNKKVLWDEAFVSLGISDLRGVQENISMKWNGKDYHFDPGAENSGIITNGVSSLLSINPDTKKFSFSLDLTLRGSNGLSFIPLGKETNVDVQSTWPHPKFYGAFPTDSKEISDSGFNGKWKVLYLNRPFPQIFEGTPSGIDQSGFGVRLFEPINQYKKAERSAKYAILFIILTFITFFLIQIINSVKIHPIQFVFVGMGLCIFYVLLLSLSEHIGFDWAYLVAAAGIILEITLYVKSILASKKLTWLIFTLLSVLYIFIYTIIQLQDFSLLMGSIGLFLVLGAMMYLSRNIDWPNLKRKEIPKLEIE